MTNEQERDIILWSDNTWCYRSELHTMTHMSDDYLVIPVGSLHYPDGITIFDVDYDKVIATRKVMN
jgi:hypothetical protein